MAHTDAGLRGFLLEALVVFRGLHDAAFRLDGIRAPVPDVQERIGRIAHRVRYRGIKVKPRILFENAVDTEWGPADHVTANHALRRRKFRTGETLERSVVHPEIDDAVHEKT